MPEPVTTRVTKRNYPAVFAAFREIDYDNGAVNRLEPERTFYDVPEPWIAVLDVAQTHLGALSEDDLNTFCCGEESERNAMPIPAAVNNLLGAYFWEWQQ